MRPLLFLAAALPAAALPLAAAAQSAAPVATAAQSAAPVAGTAQSAAPAAAAPEPEAATLGLSLDPIVVSANRAPTEAERTGSSVSVLTAPEMQADGRPFVLQQIRDLPGVTIDQSGPPGSISGVSVRGAPSRYVRVEVDGIEVSDPSGVQVTPYLQGLLVDDASRVEVLKGSQSALYGGQAVGGVISVTSPRATEPGLQNAFLLEGGSFSSFRGSYTLTGMNDRGDFSLSASHFQTDGFSAAEERDGNREDDDFRTTRLSASGRLHVTGQADIFGAGFWQKQEGNFDNGPGAFGDADNPFETTLWGLRGGTDFTTDAGLASTLAASVYDTRREQTQFATDSTFKGRRAKVEYLGAWTYSDAVGLQFGADWTREDSSSTYDAEQENWIAGAWGQASWTPTDAFVFTGAFRADRQSEFGYYPTARATFAWIVAPETTIRGSLANGFRAPSNYELFSVYGDPDLQPETSVSADLGVARSFAEGRGQASATLFWLEIDDLIEFVSLPAAPWGVYTQTDGTAKSRGLELAASWAFNDLLGLRAAYTYTDAEQPDGAPRNRVPKHDLALTATGAYKRLSYDLGADFVWDYVDDSAIDFATGGVLQSEGWADDFVVVNARIAYAVTDAAEIYVRAENLFDEQYQTSRGYSTSDRAFYGGITARF